MTLTKLCPECSKVEDTITELEDGGYNCATCKNQGRISVEISAVDIYKEAELKNIPYEENIKRMFISAQYAKEIIEENINELRDWIDENTQGGIILKFEKVYDKIEEIKKRLSNENK